MRLEIFMAPRNRAESRVPIAAVDHAAWSSNWSRRVTGRKPYSTALRGTRTDPALWLRSCWIPRETFTAPLRAEAASWAATTAAVLPLNWKRPAGGRKKFSIRFWIGPTMDRIRLPDSSGTALTCSGQRAAAALAPAAEDTTAAPFSD